MRDGASGPVKGPPYEACRTSGLAEQLYQSSNAPVLCSLLSSACNCSLRFETLRGISQTLLAQVPVVHTAKSATTPGTNSAVSTGNTSTIYLFLAITLDSPWPPSSPPGSPQLCLWQLAISILLGRASGIRLAVRSAILLIGLASPLTCSHDCSR
jgi:hypothetical protein